MWTVYKIIFKRVRNINGRINYIDLDINNAIENITIHDFKNITIRVSDLNQRYIKKNNLISLIGIYLYISTIR